jgi:hypothetical protein
MGFFGGGGAASPDESLYGRSVYGIGTSTPSITVSDYSGGSATSVTFGSGKALIAPEAIVAAQSRNFTTGIIRFTPFYFHKTTTINKFAIFTATAPASQRLVHCGFYTSNSSGLPETFVTGSGQEFTIGTGIGTNRAFVKSYGTPISISKGIVWHYSWTDGTVDLYEVGTTVRLGSLINLFGWQAANPTNTYSLNYTKTYSATPVSSLVQSFGAGSTQDTFFYSTSVPPSHFVGLEVEP